MRVGYGPVGLEGAPGHYFEIILILASLRNRYALPKNAKLWPHRLFLYRNQIYSGVIVSDQKFQDGCAKIPRLKIS